MLFLFFYNTINNTDQKTNVFGKNENYKERINMINYVSPPHCVDCPGENGTAVYLTVCFVYLFIKQHF
jgi:hypothetical protein